LIGINARGRAGFHADLPTATRRLTMTRTLLAIALLGAFSAGAQDVTYRKDIGPLFQKKCSGCHGAASPYLGEFQADAKKFEAAMKGPRMDTYADLIMFVAYPDTGALQRRLDDGKSAKDGKSGNMYKFLGATEEERQQNLALVKQWAGAWNLNRWKARGESPAITKENLDALKLAY
jgi:hypothetical protein